jgi:catechol 2,3-dioxygenase-like lactoylglutathione lyase family enzyme
MGSSPLLRLVDAVTIPVPDLDEGLRFYRDQLSHQLLWRHDGIGQAGLLMPDSTTEIVLSTEVGYAPNWLVASLDDALDRITAAGGRVVDQPVTIPVGRLAVVADPFVNRLVLLDLSAGRYVTNAAHEVVGVTKPPSE